MALFQVVGFSFDVFLDVQNEHIAVNSQNAEEYSIKIDNTQLKWAQRSLLST